MIITLLSDLGMKDIAVAAVKATLLRYVPDAELVDISHYAARDDAQQAAYLLQRACKSFEKGSVHIVLVDVFAGSSCRMLTAKKDGHFFIAPDNGILSLALGNQPENVRECFTYSKPFTFEKWIDDAGSVAATIQQGWVMPYPKTALQNIPVLRSCQVTPLGIDCNILYIDRFKNVVLDISRKQFETITANRDFVIRTRNAQQITAINRHYNEVEEGRALCRFNSMGYMEIAINRGNAASALGLDMASPADLKYRTVRIFL